MQVREFPVRIRAERLGPRARVDAGRCNLVVGQQVAQRIAESFAPLIERSGNDAIERVSVGNAGAALRIGDYALRRPNPRAAPV